jgi:hypothetical protein
MGITSMAEPTKRVEVVETRVTIWLRSGVRIDGTLFVEPGRRLSDLLNDNRKFLPIHCRGDELIMANKDDISYISQNPMVDLQKLRHR